MGVPPVSPPALVGREAEERALRDAVASARDSGGRALVVEVGDGHKGRGRRVTHRYRKPGRYTVTLTVRDRAGHKAHAKHKVRVRR